MLKDKKVIFFDMGNTILDFHQGLRDDEKDLIGLSYMVDHLKTLKLDYTIETLQEEFLKPFYGQFHRRIKDLVEVDVKPYLRAIGIHDDINQMALLRCFYKPYMDTVVVNKGAMELLKVLSQSKKIGIISNCFLPAFLYKEIFIQKHMDAYVTHYVFSYDLMIRKPNPVIFQVALDLFDIESEAALMIGDGYTPDILGAAQVGMDSIWYNPNHRDIQDSRTSHLKGVINSFYDLLIQEEKN